MEQAIVIQSAATVREVAQRALEIVIHDDTGWRHAQLQLIETDLVQKGLEDDEETLKRPFLAELKRIREATKPLKDLVMERRAMLAKKITDYEEARDRAAREAQAKDLKKWEKQITRVENKAEAQGLPVPITAPPPVRETVAKTQAVGGAQITTRVTKDWRIRDVIVDGLIEPIDPETLTYADALRLGLAIPAKHFILDTAAIGRIIRSGGEVQDIIAYEKKGKVVTHGGK
jgi:hypothetical protein